MVGDLTAFETAQSVMRALKGKFEKKCCDAREAVDRQRKREFFDVITT